MADAFRHRQGSDARDSLTSRRGWPEEPVNREICAPHTVNAPTLELDGAPMLFAKPFEAKGRARGGRNVNIRPSPITAKVNGCGRAPAKLTGPAPEAGRLIIEGHSYLWCARRV